MDQHRNPDGTYDGAAVMSSMTGLSKENVKKLWAQVKENHTRLESCPYHEFEQSKKTAMLRSLTHQRYVCIHCGGEIDHQAYMWHERGRRPKP